MSHVDLSGIATVPVVIAPPSTLRTHKAARESGLKLRDVYTNRHTGWDIHVFADGIRDTVSRHGFPFQALIALPDLVEKSTHVASEAYVGSEKNVKRVHLLYAPLKLDSEMHVASLTVFERDDGVEDETMASKSCGTND